MPRANATTEEVQVEKKPPRKRAAPKKKATTKAKTTTKAAPKKRVAKAAPKTAAKKAPRKTPAKRTTTAAAKKAPRKPKKETVVEEETEEIETVAPSEEPTTMPVKTRKAPTAFAASAAQKRARNTQAIVIAVLLIVGVGSSAVVAMSDPEAGQINVTQTIQERNARMANMVEVDGPVVVAGSSNNKPDGGFIGLKPVDSTTVTTPAPIASTTAATTTASSSDPVSDADTATSTTAAAENELAMRDNFSTDTATTTVTATTTATN